MSLTIRLNGERTEVDAATIADLMANLGVRDDEKGVAVACNGAVVPRRTWAETGLSEGDELDVVRPFQGG